MTYVRISIYAMRVLSCGCLCVRCGDVREVLLVVRKVRMPRPARATLRKNGPFFECFPYVCPEPVLVKHLFLYINDAKGPFLLTARLVWPVVKEILSEGPRYFSSTSSSGAGCLLGSDAGCSPSGNGGGGSGLSRGVLLLLLLSRGDERRRRCAR
jgi:hypothetical protein